MKNILNRKKNKIIGISIIVLALILIGIRISLSSGESSYLKNQNVDGLSFENAKLNVNNDGTTTFTVDVYNENKTEYPLKYIDIKFKDEHGEITTLTGYIGEKLESDEGRVIEASTDKDLQDTVSLEYAINK